ncbi:MAG: hypothetical protein JRD68_09440, partial [Deltaproteobacteria bacterium]|nr:hypothetical protein [Deltaproteobacteria bacterium]
FAYMASSGRPEREALILTKSIRDFGGGYSENPVWGFEPDNSERVPDTTRHELESLDVRLIPFIVEETIWKFPFAAKMYAAAQAEDLAAGQASFLAWMDTQAIVIREPGDLLPGAGKHLGYRPVDHTLIGSRLSEPVDEFWDMIYRECGVREENLFPMTASVDDFEIRPYFNAGLVAVNPVKGIFRVCRDHFQRLHGDVRLERFYEKNFRYKIFMHQAVLTGAILATLKREELKEFSPLVNYPLHMHVDYPEARRPKSLNDLVTIRYEAFFQNPDWQNVIPVRDPLKNWIEEQL